MRIFLAILLLASLDLSSAVAAQMLRGTPDDLLQANISRTELTLIRVEGQRIRRIFGTEEEFMVIPDADTGTAYIKADTEQTRINLFVLDELNRTWRLALTIIDGFADTIVIGGEDERKVDVLGLNHDMPRNKAIKQYLLALESSSQGSGIEARQENQVIPLWQDSLFVLVKVASGHFRGEKFKLTNLSPSAMVIDERELYRKGVLAISIEQPKLQPAQSTFVYIISENAQ
ncbi:MAG: type-F conjugative transfer system secretin TraK [Nitrosomonas sp.]|uniref:Conjugal transfer pilus assembly protein TraK n=1 Tax=Nitrosomonas aestuarii TaxID=52441 RepID=A0A1I4DKG0_9PROT|nr:type-F conjugative transfer system secretin TraK [Nitrosomonas aestuarii]MBX3630301.1 type-F conjugative transfer system secretin TraK [Nitrosomonas sp.]SFK93583.1 conjugal transfer pilus assembly protein TraK [Nitrosomonas aestuarii]